MLTALKIITKSNSFQPCTGTCQLFTSDSNLDLKASTGGYFSIGLGTQLLSRAPEKSDANVLCSINGISPDLQTGKFFLLGSVCTSVVDHTDAFSDSLMPATDQHTLSIFDGCFPCNNCSTLAQLQQDIQNCQIWINGLKDCNLYNQPAAARLWNNMLNKKVQQSISCKLDSTITQNRSEDFGQAIKLLYQYKAVVAMWNYLVRTKSGITQILQAPQDYSGFVIQSKRNIDSCGKLSPGIPTFRVKITLSKGVDNKGQVPSYLSAASLGIGFYISKVDQNSYIEYGRDTGTAYQRNSSGVSMNILQVSYTETDSIEIQVLFVFQPTKVAASTFSASVKILPVIYKLDHEQAPASTPSAILLSKWIALRSYATTIEQAEQAERNTWNIQTTWTIPDQNDPNLDQDYIYYTAYSKYPEESDSLSPSE